MRVLIVGEGKSGTTALMRSVAACLTNPVEMFEPTQISPDDLKPPSLVVKKLLLNWDRKENKLLDDFDKRLLIVRDPRDRIISHLLYDAYNRAPRMSQSQRDRWLATLTRKAENPSRVAMSQLMYVWWQVSGSDLMSHYVRALDRGIAFERRTNDSFHTVSYEDYVLGEFQALNDYLELVIEPGVVTGEESRVSRSKAAGAWREWFTPKDVKLFRPITQRWLDETARGKSDWKLDIPDALDEATSVGYVGELFDRVPVPAKRAKAKSPKKG